MDCAEVYTQFKKLFSKSNLKKILAAGGPLGVTTAILLSFGFVNPQLVLTALISLEGTALYDLLKESFTKKEYNDKEFRELCKKLKESPELQTILSSLFEDNWDGLTSIIKGPDEEYRHLIYRHLIHTMEVLQDFKISQNKIDTLYTNMKIKSFEIYVEYEDPLQGFENVRKEIVNTGDILNRPEISKIIEHFENKDGILCLEGYPTSGKSFVAYLVAREWLNKGRGIAILRQGQVFQEIDAILLRKESFLTIADLNNELTDMEFRNLEHSARKCFITRRLGEFAETSKVIELRLSEKFVQDDDYLYSSGFNEGSYIRCFLGEFKEIEKYITICEKIFGIKIEESEYNTIVRELASASIIKGEDRRSSTVFGYIYSVFMASRLKKLETLSLETMNQILGGETQFEDILQGIYRYSWNENQKKLARALKFLNLYLGDYVFSKAVVEKAYEVYNNNMEGYESALATLQNIRALGCNGHLAFWHPLQLDVVKVELSNLKKIDIVRRLIQELEKSSEKAKGPERMEILFCLARISYLVDRYKSISVIRTLRKEDEYFGRLGISFMILKAIDEFYPAFNIESLREFLELVKVDNLADQEIKFSTLSIALLLIFQSDLENRENLIRKTNTLALESLEKEGEQENFYSMCIAMITELELSEEEKVKWTEKIETMAKKTLEKGKEWINFYSFCIVKIVQSELSKEKKLKWIEKIETMAKETLEKGEERSNFYSFCIINMAQSEISEEEKVKWIEKIETMAKRKLEREIERFNFYSMCIAKIVQSEISKEKKLKWIEKIETMAKETLEKGNEQENFYSMCIAIIAQSEISEEEKVKWIEKIETIYKRALEEGEERSNFYSMCIAKIVQSEISKEKKLKWIEKIETMAKETLEKGEEQENFYSMCIVKIAQSELSEEEKVKWIEKIETIAKRALEEGEERSNFYSMCIVIIAQSESLEEKTVKWIERIETMAKETLERGNEQINFYSMCIASITELKLLEEEKVKWIEKIEIMAKETLERGNEQENFYSMCILQIIQSEISEEKKLKWIERIETMARRALEKGEERSDFYSMSIANIAQSELSEEEKVREVNFICSLVRKHDFESQQIIFSHCLVRIALLHLPCIYLNLILQNSSNEKDLKIRSEDLVFDNCFGENAFKVLYYVLKCLK